MMKSRWTGPVILAAGIIASAAIASMTSESRLVLVAPLLMAATLSAVGVFQHRIHGAPRASVRASIIMGVVIVAAAAIVARRDPARVATLLPVLGGALAVLVIGIPGKAARGDRDGGV